MRWVKARERLPEKAGRKGQVIVKYGNAVYYGFKNFDEENPKMYIETDTKSFLTLDCEWLDQSQSGEGDAVDELEWVRKNYHLVDGDYYHKDDYYGDSPFSAKEIHKIYLQSNHS